MTNGATTTGHPHVDITPERPPLAYEAYTAPAPDELPPDDPGVGEYRPRDGWQQHPSGLLLSSARRNGAAATAQADWRDMLLDGGSFILDGADDVAAIWGEGSTVLWAEGEALIITGPAGAGKTTLVGQIVRARIGYGTGVHRVLGLPVAPTGSRVLYLAMDRPSQIRRSLRRQLAEIPRAELAKRLVVWKGPPPQDLAANPALLLDTATAAGADTVVIDSLKDAFIGLTDDATAAGYNQARQRAITAGVQIIELHHMVKRGEGGAAPTRLSDVYGSTWITAGVGSVLLLWGEAGDPIVRLTHLKPIVDTFGPHTVQHDHDAGTSQLTDVVDLYVMAKAATSINPLTVISAARALFETGDRQPSKAEQARARRKLQQHPGCAKFHRTQPVAALSPTGSP